MNYAFERAPRRPRADSSGISDVEKGEFLGNNPAFHDTRDANTAHEAAR